MLQPERLRDEGFLEELRACGADLFVVVAFRMLPEVVWRMPRLGTINLHASLLPQYRGAAPINRAVMDGAHSTGLTTFLLQQAIDTGDVLLQETPTRRGRDRRGAARPHGLIGGGAAGAYGERLGERRARSDTSG